MHIQPYQTIILFLLAAPVSQGQPGSMERCSAPRPGSQATSLFLQVETTSPLTR